jgi:hypothetical protein
VGIREIFRVWKRVPQTRRFEKHGLVLFLLVVVVEE